MALNPLKLANRDYGDGQNSFTYQTADARATVIASGYFNGVSSQLNKGDVITARCSTGGTETVDLLRVTSADQTTPVTVAATALT